MTSKSKATSTPTTQSKRKGKRPNGRAPSPDVKLPAPIVDLHSWFEAAAGASRLKGIELELEATQHRATLASLERLAQTCERLPTRLVAVYCKLHEDAELKAKVRGMLTHPSRYRDATAFLVDVVEQAEHRMRDAYEYDDDQHN